MFPQSTIDSEGFKGGTRGAPIMPRDAVSRTANAYGLARIIIWDDDCSAIYITG